MRVTVATGSLTGTFDSPTEYHDRKTAELILEGRKAELVARAQILAATAEFLR